MRCRSGRATQRMRIDTSNGAHRPRLQSPAAKARTRDSTATVSRPRATVYFGRKVPSCHRMAFYDRFPAQLPSEMAVKCQDASAWHFTAIPLRARDPRTRAPAPLHPCTPPHLHIGSSTRVARGAVRGTVLRTALGIERARPWHTPPSNARSRRASVPRFPSDSPSLMRGCPTPTHVSTISPTTCLKRSMSTSTTSPCPLTVPRVPSTRVSTPSPPPMQTPPAPGHPFARSYTATSMPVTHARRCCTRLHARMSTASSKPAWRLSTSVPPAVRRMFPGAEVSP